MIKKVRTFVVCLKVNMVRPGTWVFCACMLFFLYLVEVVAVPQPAMPIAGLHCGGSKTALQIAELLTKADTDSIGFRLYEDETLLHEDVETGKLVCGFSFADDFEDAFWNGKLKKRVTCIETPFSNETEVFKEAFFAALFRVYSTRIMKAHQSEIFRNPSDALTDNILRANAQYLSGEALFTPEEVFVDTIMPEEPEDAAGLTCRVDLRGLFYLILFLFLLAISGTLARKGREGMLGALCPVDAVCFRISSMITGVLVPLIAGTVFLHARGLVDSVWSEGLHLLLFLVYSCIWIELFGRHVIWRECGTKLVSLAAFCLLVLPVLIDFSSVFPPIRLLRYLLPVSVYLL